MKTIFSAVAAIFFSLGSVGAATVDFEDRGPSSLATQVATVTTTLEG